MTIALDVPRFHLLDPRIGRSLPDEPIQVRKADSMESKIDQRESAPRLLAQDARETRRLFRQRVEEMVRDQETKVGGLMPAYRLVGRWIGVSGTTVRRLIKGAEIELRPETLQAGDAAFARHESRLEATARAIMERVERRRTESDAILARAGCSDPGRNGLAPQPRPEASRSSGRS